MKQYLGLEIMQARPLSKQAYATLYQKAYPETDCDGYEVTYDDGLIDWFPKEFFEKICRPVDGLTFGLAIEALKQGKKVARKGWNGKGMYLWLKPEALVKEHWVRDEILLHAIKSSGFTTAVDDNNPEPGNCKAIKALGTICMKTADNCVLTGWLASQTDMLAEDWEIIN